MSMAEAIQQRLKGFFPEVLGIRVVEATPERVVCEMEARNEFCTVPDVVHGGAIMSLADTAGAVGTVLNLQSGGGTTTIESKTNFLGTARAGKTLRAECEPLHRGKQTMVWQTRVSSGEKLVAVVTQTQMVLAPAGQAQAPEEVVASLFAGKSPAEQKDLLAKLERGGAAVYRALAQAEEDEAVKEALMACADREDENADVLTGGSSR